MPILALQYFAASRYGRPFVRGGLDHLAPTRDTAIVQPTVTRLRIIGCYIAKATFCIGLGCGWSSIMRPAVFDPLVLDEMMGTFKGSPLPSKCDRCCRPKSSRFNPSPPQHWAIDDTTELTTRYCATVDTEQSYLRVFVAPHRRPRSWPPPTALRGHCHNNSCLSRHGIQQEHRHRRGYLPRHHHPHHRLLLLEGRKGRQNIPHAFPRHQAQPKSSCCAGPARGRIFKSCVDYLPYRTPRACCGSRC